jgi:hypothetical protein
MQQNNSRLTGGCQCGAVRFRAERLGRPSICHCRMCQKAFGGLFGPLVTGYGVAWTRGAPKHFQSSDKVRRGFCGDCGTPLTYEVEGAPTIELAIGAFDDPTVAAPVIQTNPKDKLPFFDSLTGLPVRTDVSPHRLAFMASLHSHQHPDHDTNVWPPKQGFPA